MGVKVATTCLHWSQPLVPHSPSSSQHVAASSSPIDSLSTRARRRTHTLVHAAVLRSGFLRSSTSRLLETGSFQYPRRKGLEQNQILRRTISATLERFSDDEDDEEFILSLQELALRFDEYAESDAEEYTERESSSFTTEFSGGFTEDFSSHAPSPGQIEAEPPAWLGIRPEPPDWPERQEIFLASVEWNANSVDLPFSLRIIKRKKKWEEGLLEAGESACCSVKKAFSSMVFIIRELQSYALQMREILFYEDLRGILTRVQQEVHASFCWLFQQIFSCTPTLMVSVMLLLANFTVHSMAHHAAIAAVLPHDAQSAVVEHQHRRNSKPRFDSSSIKTFSAGKTASVRGNGGGGGRVRPVAGAADDGRSENHRWTTNSTATSSTPSEAEEEQAAVPEEEETTAWNRIVEEANRMKASSRDEALMDHETLQRFVSPVVAEAEKNGGASPEYFRTELLYQQAVSEEPHNPLLLCNYAQFLYLVVHDHDRAEYYFKRAVRVEPPDPDSLSRYANFLWLGRNDLEAAEETYLEAISADPGNTHHAANYAHFLWNTGGEDTCYPLDDCDD